MLEDDEIDVANFSVTAGDLLRGSNPIWTGGGRGAPHWWERRLDESNIFACHAFPGGVGYTGSHSVANGLVVNYPTRVTIEELKETPDDVFLHVGGRQKPDLIASSYSGGSSSFVTPTVAGLAGLIISKLRLDQKPDRNLLVKAIILAGCKKRCLLYTSDAADD